jgi:Tol biopolymer transport system component/DNA-binding winged helix-turn-helix (wHTH) protein
MMPDEVLSYQFDDVIVDLRAGRVTKAGQSLALEPKAFDLLLLLVSRSGELVTRQEVLDRVWAGVYVTDNAVARVVAQLRRVLGDAARDARYIETVPTRGYRFIGPVQRQLAPVSLPPAAPVTDEGRLPPAAAPEPTPAAMPARDGAHPFWAAGFALLAFVSLFFAWRSAQREPSLAKAPLRTQLTSSSGLDAFPAWSPDGTAVAYASDRSGRFELFIRDIAAGGDRLAVTSDGAHNVQPAWSPDGSTLAYHSPGRGGIWVVARTGGTPRQVSVFGSRPDWSPDGKHLAFQGAPYTEPSAAAFETFGPSSLWTVPVAGGTPRRITTGWRPEGSHTRPTWFPDGKRLFFASQALELTTFWIVDVASGALTRVHEPGRRALDPMLTPDGRHVYYVRMDAHFDLWRLPLDTDGTAAGPAQLVLPPSELDVRHVAVHPDGRQLAYVAMSTVAGLRTLPLHPDGVPAGPSVRLAEDAVRTARRPSFSPDARSVVFERQSAGLPPTLWLFDLQRATARVLARTDDGETDPAWSADGREVYYVSGRGDRRALRAVQVETGQTRSLLPLATTEHDVLRPRLSPDGTRLAYTRSQEGQLEVWVRTMRTARPNASPVSATASHSPSGRPTAGHSPSTSGATGTRRPTSSISRRAPSRRFRATSSRRGCAAGHPTARASSLRRPTRAGGTCGGAHATGANNVSSPSTPTNITTSATPTGHRRATASSTSSPASPATSGRSDLTDAPRVASRYDASTGTARGHRRPTRHAKRKLQALRVTR